MPRKIEFKVESDYDGAKIKVFLRGKAGISSHLLVDLKKYENGITLNGKHARTIDTVKEGDIVAVNIREKHGEIEGVEMPLEILYEDDDIIAVNKSPFLAVHPSHNHQGDTLANAIVYHLQKENKSTVFRSVGRLDKGTSGVIICALNPHAAAKIPSTAKKEYIAVPSGITDGKGTIDAPIYRPDPIITVRTVDPRGDKAVTHYQKIAGNEKFSLVRVQLETGRTHQIRVHFAHLGMPLVGDSLYGEDEFSIGHQLLHCRKVEITHPVSGERLIFEAKAPRDMADFIKAQFGEDVYY